MAFDWKALVRTVAPALATALGTPVAGIAVAALSEALLGRTDGTEDELATVLMTGGHEALLKLKQAEITFQQRMAELEIDLERIHQGDRASAREREAKTGDSWTPRWLAFFVTAGFFGCLGWLLVNGKPPVGGDALLIMLGALGGAWAQVVSYYYGSTKGSADKTALLATKTK